MRLNLASVLLAAFATAVAVRAHAQTFIELYDGSHSSWPTAWISLPSLNDPVGAGVEGKLDFVGDAANPGYLVGKSGTGLGLDQTWSIALASIRNATDHNVISADVAGGAGLGSPLGNGWSAEILLQPIPEPSINVLLVGTAVAWFGHRIRGRRRR